MLRLNLSERSEDSIILAARESDGVWISADVTAAIDRDLASIVNQYPQVGAIHARPSADLYTLIFGVKTTAPWIDNWRTGNITTGETILDDLIDQYGPAEIQDNLFESGEKTWFTVKFGGPLN